MRGGRALTRLGAVSYTHLEGKYQTLEKYGTDLTARARAGNDAGGGGDFIFLGFGLEKAVRGPAEHGPCKEEEGVVPLDGPGPVSYTHLETSWALSQPGAQ